MLFREIRGKDYETHEGFPTDLGYQLPDRVWALPKEERRVLASLDAGRCRFEGRFFIRGVLRVPIVEGSEDFGWGVWVEVDRDFFARYRKIRNRDASNEPAGHGTLANKIPGYGDSARVLSPTEFGVFARTRPT